MYIISVWEDKKFGKFMVVILVMVTQQCELMPLNCTLKIKVVNVYYVYFSIILIRDLNF